MEWVWITLGTLLTIAGIVGCIIPLIPGPPLSYAALLIIHFTLDEPYTSRFLILWLILTIVVTLLDYYVPIWGTKKFGGSKSGMWGSTIGLIIGICVFPPFGIIAGPFIGAVAGELLAGKDMSNAMRSGLGSFLGFIAGTIMKLTISLIMGFHFFKAII
ncbi:MAG: DUF456 domain-containing protein [Lentimicrobium sp.]|jgi:uncharacterized protein YqgC (DUF456 family)|nr:DUF456 domain-containing protein [Lentimicrobium sp.]